MVMLSMMTSLGPGPLQTPHSSNSPTQLSKSSQMPSPSPSPWHPPPHTPSASIIAHGSVGFIIKLHAAESKQSSWLSHTPSESESTSEKRDKTAKKSSMSTVPLVFESNGFGQETCPKNNDVVQRAARASWYFMWGNICPHKVTTRTPSVSISMILRELAQSFSLLSWPKESWRCLPVANTQF